MSEVESKVLDQLIKGDGKEYLTIGIQIYNKVRRETENRVGAQHFVGRSRTQTFEGGLWHWVKGCSIVVADPFSSVLLPL